MTQSAEIRHFINSLFTPRLQEIFYFLLSFVLLFIDKEYVSSMTHFFQYFLDAIIRASAQRETVESCSGGSGGLIRLNASQVIHDFNV